MLPRRLQDTLVPALLPPARLILPGHRPEQRGYFWPHIAQIAQKSGHQVCELPLRLVLGLRGFHTSFSAEGQTQCKWVATSLITHVDFSRVSRESYIFLDPRNYLENAGLHQYRVYNVLVLDFLWFPDSLIQTFTALLLPHLHGC